MKGKNMVFIARSLDGFIAGKNGEIDWLHSVPNPENSDLGYVKFMNQVDALVMGRKTFETVCNFDGKWPYKKPVFVLSKTLSSIPKKCKDKAFIVNGSLGDIIQSIQNQGYDNLYIDGGATVQSFLNEDLIDEMTITTIPILLGGGIPLFKDLDSPLEFEHLRSEIFLSQLVQDTYKRKKA